MRSTRPSARGCDKRVCCDRKISIATNLTQCLSRQRFLCRDKLPLAMLSRQTPSSHAIAIEFSCCNSAAHTANQRARQSALPHMTRLGRAATAPRCARQEDWARVTGRLGSRDRKTGLSRQGHARDPGSLSRQTYLVARIGKKKNLPPGIWVSQLGIKA